MLDRDPTAVDATRKRVTEAEVREAFLGDPNVIFVLNGPLVQHRPTKVCPLYGEHLVVDCSEWNA